MTDLSFEKIEPLIAETEQSGSTVKVTFKCPISDNSVQSSGTVQKQASTQSAISQSAKRSLWYSLRYQISNVIRRTLGYNMVGRMGSSIAHSAMSNTSRGSMTIKLNEAEKKEAAVLAFKKVEAQFVWDRKNTRMISAKAAEDLFIDFDKQLGRVPVKASYDRGVMARMMVEVAVADAALNPKEMAFFEEYGPNEVGSVEELATKSKLSKAELEEVSQSEVRDSMLMAAWGMGMADQALTAKEEDILGQFASWLGIADERANALKGYAQSCILDRGLDAAREGGTPVEGLKEKALLMAPSLGMANEGAERLEVRYRKRHGLL